MTHDDQIKFKPVQCLFKHEIVFPSLKDDCHPGPAHFGNDQFPFGNHNQGEKKVIKSLDSFFFDAVQPIQVPFKNQSRITLKQYIYFFLILIIRIRLGVENHKTKFPTELICLYFIKLIIRKKNHHFYEKNNPCTSEKADDSADEKLQLKTIHQTVSSVMEQSINNSSYDPPFFKHKAQFN